VQKIFYLPEAHTDFILAIIGEELGVAGLFAVLFLYGLVAYAGLRVAKRASGAYAKLLAAGVTSLILSQACLNIFTVLGLAPLTGVPLPFISYGSTNLTVLLAGMGLLLNVAAGGRAHLKVVTGSRRDGADDRHRGGRNGGARGARARGRRRAAS
jgi:cell division protein FtsW